MNHMHSIVDIKAASCLSDVSSAGNSRAANCQSDYQSYGSQKDNRRPLLDYSHQVVLREDRISPSNNGLLFAQEMGHRKALPMPSTLQANHRQHLNVDLVDSFNAVKWTSEVLYRTINEDHWPTLRQHYCGDLLAILTASLDDRIEDLEKIVQSFEKGD